MTSRIPCRVSADLRIFQQEQAAFVAEEFNEDDDYHLRQIVPDRLVKPLMELLSTLRQINGAERIEGLNKERALDWLRRDTEAVRQALLELWADL